jgi:hypothetical protein
MVSSSMAARNPPCTVPAGLRKHLDRFEAGFDAAALAVDLDKFEAERLRAGRRRQPAIDHFPEKRILVHDAALTLICY